MGRFNCFCVDQSDNSLHAFQWYLNNYHRTDDTIGLIHVSHVPKLSTLGVYVGGSIALENKVHQEMADRKSNAEEVMGRFVSICDASNFPYKLLFTEDHRSPGEVICEITKQNNAELVVMAQRGLSDFSRTLLGSTSDYVLHNAHTPVIIVPPPTPK